MKLIFRCVSAGLLTICQMSFAAEETMSNANPSQKESGIILERAVQDDKVMQGFKSESFVMVGDHSQMVKAPTITNDSGLKDCVNLSPSTAVSRIIPKQETDIAIFTPPTGWRLADANALPPSVKVMVVGKGEHDFPPSINLGTETFNGTLKEYLKVIKTINDAQGASWKDLGMIKTEAGEASLSQLDTKTEWGDIRMMHVIFVKNGTVYILTSASLQSEFPKFYKDFFTAMRSLRFN